MRKKHTEERVLKLDSKLALLKILNIKKKYRKIEKNRVYAMDDKTVMG